MRGIDLPAREEDFTADPVELFFDLAYVFAFSQLVGRLVARPTWAGVAETGLLFALLWLPWQQLTWAANAVSGNGRGVRAVFLLATAVCVPMAASVSSALDGGGPLFAGTLTTIMVLGFAIQALGADRGTGYSAAVRRWVAPNAAAVAVLMVGSFADGGLRVGLWSASAVIVIGAMVAAGRGEWVIRSGHMAERHGLIVIVALGEVIVAIGLPVVEAFQLGAGIDAATVVALASAGAFAGLLWWAYFDRVGPALEHRAEALEGDEARGRYVRDVYTAAHALIVAGIILAAAALEEITLHPSDPVELGFRAMLAGGLAAATLGVVVAIRRAFGVLAKERLLGAAAIGAAVLTAGALDGVVLLVAVVVLVALTLVLEHRRIEH